MYVQILFSLLLPHIGCPCCHSGQVEDQADASFVVDVSSSPHQTLFREGGGGKTLFPHGTRSQKLKSPELVTREPKTKCCARFQGSYNSANMCFMFFSYILRFPLMCLSPFRVVLPGPVDLFLNPPSWDFISRRKILPIFPIFGR